MKEYRTIKAEPKKQDCVTKTMGYFGWKLFSSQEIYNESSEVNVDTYSDSVYVNHEKTITNYVTLKFERDTEMPRYSELKKLYSEYEATAKYSAPESPSKLTSIAVIGTLIVIFLSVFIIKDANYLLAIPVSVLCVILYAIITPILVVQWKNYKKKHALYWQMQRRHQEILQTVKKGDC